MLSYKRREEGINSWLLKGNHGLEREGEKETERNRERRRERVRKRASQIEREGWEGEEKRYREWD